VGYFKIGPLETPESNNSPTIVGDLKKLAEQIVAAYAPLAQAPQSGDLKLTARKTLDEGWLACEGQEVSRTTYKALFEAIGTAYGEGNKSTTFNLPNYIERVAMGPGGTNKVGAKLGTSTVTLTTGQLAEHSHVDAGHIHNPGSVDWEFITLQGAGAAEFAPGGSQNFVGEKTTGTGKASLENAGAGEAHNNIQPSTVCNVWIKT
jgi:microcystin-dependent protein